MNYGIILLYHSYLPSCMVTVVTAGLRETAVGASMVVRFTLKDMAVVSALNLVVTSAHWLGAVLEKVRSIDSGT